MEITFNVQIHVLAYENCRYFEQEYKGSKS